MLNAVSIGLLLGGLGGLVLWALLKLMGSDQMSGDKPAGKKETFNEYRLRKQYGGQGSPKFAAAFAIMSMAGGMLALILLVTGDWSLPK